jgi:hypothetical protein
VADAEQLFRLIQSIPSPKVEPFKQWLAQVASERLDEMQDPELSIDRALEQYMKLGYSEKWINQSVVPTPANIEYGFMNYFLNTDKKFLPSAPDDVFVHIGNGTNMIYVDRKNELIAVVRWIENASMDGFVSRMLSAINK